MKCEYEYCQMFSSVAAAVTQKYLGFGFEEEHFIGKLSIVSNVKKLWDNCELRKQENNEALRRSFAEKANQVGHWIERQMDAVAAIGMGRQGSLEEQLSRLREYEEAVYQFKPHHEELERINQQIQESFVFENRYTQYTMETLRVGWEQSVTSVNRTINEVENQILLKFGCK